MVWPWSVVNTVMDFRIIIAGAFSTEFPDRPAVAVHFVKISDDIGEIVAVGLFRVG